MKIKNFFKYSVDFLQSAVFKIFFKKPMVMSDEDTLDYIILNKCSIARYGDGELRLMRGIDLEFQEYNTGLAKKLKNVQNTKDCLICIPSIFDKKIFNTCNITEDEFKYWSKFKRNRGGLWNFYFSKKGIMGDAFLSRFYLRKKNKENIDFYIEKIKKLWNDRNIIIVEGYTSKVGVDNDLLSNAKSIKRILCPNINAYKYYDQILKNVKDNFQKDDLIILALGPTATALAYDLSLLKIQALDMGHFDIEYEWYLANTKVKIPVKNKHVNECETIGTEESDNEQYINQIISRIGDV